MNKGKLQESTIKTKILLVSFKKNSPYRKFQIKCTQKRLHTKRPKTSSITNQCNCQQSCFHEPPCVMFHF